MPSSFTDALGLEKQATGENDGTWGDLLAADREILDDAIAAVLPKSVAGASDVTLTTVEAMHATQKYTGVLTASISVIMPDKDRKWTAFNNTTGAFTLTVKTSAGTGILVPQGLTYQLYCDGTNVEFGSGPNLFGREFLLDADGDSSFTADTDDRLDLRLQGVDLFRWNGSVANPVNGMDFIARATGSPATIQAQGSDANVGFDLRDDNGNEMLVLSAVAAAINELTIANAAIGNDPSLAATGGDTNINLNFLSKGSGVVQANGNAIYFVSGTDVAITDGGTGASTVVGAQTNLSLLPGTDIQVFDAVLEDLAALPVVALNEFIVGTGAGTYGHQNPATARASMGAGVLDNVSEDTSPQSGGVWDTNSFAINESEGSNVASGATPNIWVTNGNTLHMTGSITVTGFAAAPRIGAWRKLIIDAAPLFTDGANLIVEGNANFQAAAGDLAWVYAETTTQFRMYFKKADGTAVVAAGLGAHLTDLDALAAVTGANELMVSTGAGAWAFESGGTLLTSIGLGTADSPQFTGIEVGAVADTTLTRASAGNLAVEGNLVYRAGGADVAIADGGHGASTASAGFDALKQAATESATGVAEIATQAETDAGTDDVRVVTPLKLASFSGLVFTESFDSGNQTITTAGSLTLAHSLSVKPVAIFCYLECAVAEGNYSVGDEVLLGPITSANNKTNMILPDATNINVRFSAFTATCFDICNKTDGNVLAATNTSWRLIVRAFA